MEQLAARAVALNSLENDYGNLLGILNQLNVHTQTLSFVLFLFVLVPVCSISYFLVLERRR